MSNTNKVVKLKQPTTKILFTEKSVLALKHRSKRYNAIDKKTGLIVRVSASPSTLKVFTTEKWFKGSIVKKDIGAVGEVTLRDARAVHNKRMMLLGEGKDFRFVAEDGLEYENIGTLMRRVLVLKSKAKKHSAETTRLYNNLLDNYIPKKLQTKTFKELKKQELIDWYLSGTSKFSSNNAKKLFNLAFNTQDLLQKKDLETPTEMLRDVFINTDKESRKHIFVNPKADTNELGELVAYACQTVFGRYMGMFTEQDMLDSGKEVPEDFEPFEMWSVEPKEHYRVQLDALMFMLLTGIRASKVYNLMWKDVDMEKGVISFKQRKRNEKQEVSFTNQLYWLMTYRHKNKPHPHCKYVFPSNKDLKKPITTIRDLMKAINKKAKIKEKQSPHSIRRTLSNVSIWLGYGKEVQDAILHHAPSGVGDINYNNRMIKLVSQLQQCHDYIDTRFAEGIIAHDVQLPHTFKETKTEFTSVFGRLYGFKDKLKKDEDFYSDVFTERTPKKQFGGTPIE